MKKTRMNSLQRKNLTNSIVDKENINVHCNHLPLTPRENPQPHFKTTEGQKESAAKHLSFRSSTGGRPAGLQIKTSGCYVPFPEDPLGQRVNTFAKKSQSTQEYLVCGTSTELSKAFRNIAREDVKSPTEYRRDSTNLRSSLNSH